MKDNLVNWFIETIGDAILVYSGMALLMHLQELKMNLLFFILGYGCASVVKWFITYSIKEYRLMKEKTKPTVKGGDEDGKE